MYRIFNQPPPIDTLDVSIMLYIVFTSVGTPD